MNLFIMRHGQAQFQAESDAQRALSEIGFLEAKVMAKWLAHENINIDYLLVSPYLRAQQTASTLVDALDVSLTLNTVDLFTPSGSALSAHDYIDALIDLERIENLLIVSHMPLVSYLTEELTVEHNSPIFQTAAIAHIEYDTKRMKGSLVKLTAPEDVC